MAEDTVKRLLVKLGVDTSEFEAAIKKIKQQMSDLQSQEKQKSDQRKTAIQQEVTAQKQSSDIVKKVLDTATQYVAKLELEEVASRKMFVNFSSALEEEHARIELETALLHLMQAESEFSAEALMNLEKQLAVDRERLAVDQARLRTQTTGVTGVVQGKSNAASIAGTQTTIKQAEGLKAVSQVEIGELSKVVGLERARVTVLEAQAKVLLTQRDYRKSEITLVNTQLEQERLLLAALEKRVGLEKQVGTQRRTTTPRTVQERVPVAPVTPKQPVDIQNQQVQRLQRQVTEHAQFVSQLQSELNVSEKILQTKMAEEGTTQREIASIQSEVTEKTKTLGIAQKQQTMLEQKLAKQTASIVLEQKERLQKQLELETTQKIAKMTTEQVVIRTKEIKDELALLTSKKSRLALMSQETGVNKTAIVQLQTENDLAIKRLKTEQDLLRTRETTVTRPVATQTGTQEALLLAGQAAVMGEMSSKQLAKNMEKVQIDRQELEVETKALQLLIAQGKVTEANGQAALKQLGIEKQKLGVFAEQLRLAQAQTGEGVLGGLREKMHEIIKTIGGGGLFGQVAGGAFTGLIGAEIFTGIAEQIHKLGEALIDASGRAGMLRIEFEKLAKDRGADPSVLVKSLRDSTRGLVSDTQLFEVSSRFMRQNMQVSNQQITKMIGTTLDLARATGRSVPEAMNALERAAATGRMQMLAYTVGLTNADLTLRGLTGSMSPAARNTLQFNQMLSAMELQLTKIAVPATTLPDLFRQITVAEGNFIDDMAQGVITSGTFGKSISDISQYLKDVHPQLESAAKSFGTDLAGALKFVVDHMHDLKMAVEALLLLKIADWGFGAIEMFKGWGVTITETVIPAITKLIEKLGELRLAQAVGAGATIVGETAAAASGAGVVTTGTVVGGAAVGGGVLAVIASLLAVTEKIYEWAVSRFGDTGPEADYARAKGVVIDPNKLRRESEEYDTEQLKASPTGLRANRREYTGPDLGPTPKPEPYTQPPLDLTSVQQKMEIAKLELKVKEEQAKQELEIAKQEIADEEEALKQKYELGLIGIADYLNQERDLRKKSLNERLAEIDETERAQKQALEQETIAQRSILNAKTAIVKALPEDTPEQRQTKTDQIAELAIENEMLSNKDVNRLKEEAMEKQSQTQRLQAWSQYYSQLRSLDEQEIHDEIDARKTYEQEIIKVQKTGVEEQTKTVEEQFKEGLVSADSYIEARQSLIVKSRDLQLQELNVELEDTTKTEKQKADISVKMVDVKIDAEKQLHQLRMNQSQIELEASENQFKRIREYLVTQESVGKLGAEMGQPEGLQEQVSAEQLLYQLTTQRIESLKKELETTEEGSKQWFQIVKDIGDATTEQMRLNEELAKMKDIMTPVIGIFGELAKILDATGNKFVGGWLNRMQGVFGQFAQFNQQMSQQQATVGGQQQTGFQAAGTNFISSFKQLFTGGGRFTQNQQTDRMTTQVSKLEEETSQSAESLTKLDDQYGQTINTLKEFRDALEQIIQMRKQGVEGTAATPSRFMPPYSPTIETLGSFQAGGMVSETGPYTLHAGEEVLSNAMVAVMNTAVGAIRKFTTSLEAAAQRLVDIGVPKRVETVAPPDVGFQPRPMEGTLPTLPSGTTAPPPYMAQYTNMISSGTSLTTNLMKSLADKSTPQTGAGSPQTTGMQQAVQASQTFAVSMQKAVSTLVGTTSPGTNTLGQNVAPTGFVGEGGPGGTGYTNLPFQVGGAPSAVPGVIGAVGGETPTTGQGPGQDGQDDVAEAHAALGGMTNAFQTFTKNMQGWMSGLAAAFSSVTGAKTTTGGAVSGAMGLGGEGMSMATSLASNGGPLASLGGMAGPIGAAIGVGLGAILGGIVGHKQQELTEQMNAVKTSLEGIQLSLQNNTQTIGGAIGQLQALQGTVASTMGQSKKGQKSGAFQATMDQINQEIQQLQIQQQQILQTLQQQLGILSQTTPAMQQVMQSLSQIVQQYQQFASAASGNQAEMANANQFLIESLQQYTVTMNNQVRSANEQAIQDALQLIDLQNQLNQANMQEYDILTQGVLARQRSSSMTKGMQIEQIEAQKNNLQEEYNVEAYKVQAEGQIFNLQNTQLGLEQQMAALQEQDVDYQVAGIEAMVSATNSLNKALGPGGTLPTGLMSATGGVNIQAIQQLLGLPITTYGQGGPGQGYIPNMPEAYQTFASDIANVPGLSGFTSQLNAAAQTAYGSQQRQQVQQEAESAVQALQSMGAITGPAGNNPNWNNFLGWIMEGMTFQQPGTAGPTTGTPPAIPGYQTGGMVDETQSAIVHAGEYIIPSDVFQNFISALNSFATVLTGSTLFGGQVNQAGNSNMAVNTLMMGGQTGLGQSIANAIIVTLKPFFAQMNPTMSLTTGGATTIPAYAEGGFIGQNELAQVHSGEVVLPKTIVDYISNMTGLSAATVNSLQPAVAGMADLPQSFANNLKLMLGIPVPGALGERTTASPPIVTQGSNVPSYHTSGTQAIGARMIGDTAGASRTGLGSPVESIAHLLGMPSIPGTGTTGGIGPTTGLAGIQNIFNLLGVKLPTTGQTGPVVTQGVNVPTSVIPETSIGARMIGETVQQAGQRVVNNNTLETHSQIMNMATQRIGLETDLLGQQHAQITADMQRITALSDLLDKMATAGTNGVLSLEGGFQKLYELRGRMGSGSFRREVL